MSNSNRDLVSPGIYIYIKYVCIRQSSSSSVEEREKGLYEGLYEGARS